MVGQPLRPSCSNEPCPPVGTRSTSPGRRAGMGRPAGRAAQTRTGRRTFRAGLADDGPRVVSAARPGDQEPGRGGKTGT